MNEIDITYCDRECANYKCRRNKEHLDKTNYCFFGVFEKCEEYIKKENEDERD